MHTRSSYTNLLLVISMLLLARPVLTFSTPLLYQLQEAHRLKVGGILYAVKKRKEERTVILHHQMGWLVQQETTQKDKKRLQLIRKCIKTWMSQLTTMLSKQYFPKGIDTSPPVYLPYRYHIALSVFRI